MTTQFPSGIDDSSNLPIVVDNVSLVNASAINVFRDAIIAIETEIGVNPSGIFNTISDRLNSVDTALQSVADSHFIGSGDLSGTASSQTVTGLQGRGVSSAAPAVNSILTWDGSVWSAKQSINVVGNVIGATLHSNVLISDGYAAPPVSRANQGIIYFDSTLQKFRISQNGGAFIDLLAGLAAAITDSNVSPTAAIAGTKISPNFGSQNIVTTGTAQAASVQLGSSGPIISFGTGVPSSSLTNGSIYLRTDGGGSTALYTRQGGSWTVLAGGGGSSVTWSGDLLGSTDSSQTVIKVNGASIPAAGSLTTGHVPRVTGVSALTYGFLTNANIDAAAAIAGTKVAPSFGSQNIVTTGSTQSNSFIIGASGPTITKGAGVPVTAQPAGSIYLRTDGTSSAAIYTYQSGAWSVLDGYVGGGGGGGGGPVDLSSDVFGILPVANGGTGRSTLTIPSSGLLVGTTDTQTITNKTINATNNTITNIANAAISTSAAIAGTKITPAFGTQNISTSGTISSGAITSTGAVVGTTLTSSGAVTGSTLSVGGVISDGTTLTVQPPHTDYTGNAKCTVRNHITNISTTDATPTPGYSWTIANNAGTAVDVTVVAVMSTSANVSSCGVYKRSMVFRRNNGSTVTNVGTNVDAGSTADSTFAGVVVGIDFSGTTGRVNVTGLTSHTIQWGITVQIQETIQ